MELGPLLEALKWVVPTLIAVISLVYVIKQRNVVKKEISRKRYLENALSNLNAVIESLRSIRILDVKKSNDYEEWEDTATDIYALTSELLIASFDLKTKKILMNISYTAEAWEKSLKKSKVGEIKTTPLGLNNLESFLNVLRSSFVVIETEVNIGNAERRSTNSPDFNHVNCDAKILADALEALNRFEEVYESLSPYCVNNVKQVFEQVATEIFLTVNQPKTIELELTKFQSSDEISEHLCKEILNYPRIADKLSKVSELISDLIEARTELFKKVG